MRLSRILVCKWLPWLLVTRLTPREIWMVPPSRVVCFEVWIVVRSGVCCIHILRVHLSLVDRTLLKQVVKSMAVRTTRGDTGGGLT